MKGVLRGGGEEWGRGLRREGRRGMRQVRRWWRRTKGTGRQFGKVRGEVKRCWDGGVGVRGGVGGGRMSGVGVRTRLAGAWWGDVKESGGAVAL